MLKKMCKGKLFKSEKWNMLIYDDNFDNKT